VRSSDLFPLQIDYYNENDVFLKSLFLEDIQTVDGVLTPMKMVMRNHLDQTESEMKYLSITYNVSFEKDFFTERNLKK